MVLHKIQFFCFWFGFFGALIEYSIITFVTQKNSKNNQIYIFSKIILKKPHRKVVHSRGQDIFLTLNEQNFFSMFIYIFVIYFYTRDLTNMAWRPLVWATAYQAYGSFIYLSPSHRVYQRLDTFVYLLEKDGVSSLSSFLLYSLSSLSSLSSLFSLFFSLLALFLSLIVLQIESIWMRSWQRCKRNCFWLQTQKYAISKF